MKMLVIGKCNPKITAHYKRLGYEIVKKDIEDTFESIKGHEVDVVCIDEVIKRKNIKAL